MMKAIIKSYVLCLCLFPIPLYINAHQIAFDFQSRCAVENVNILVEYSFYYTTGTNETVKLIWDVKPLEGNHAIVGCNVFKRISLNDKPIQLNGSLITTLNEHYSFVDHTSPDPASAPYYDIQVVADSDSLILTQIQANWLLDFKAVTTESVEMLVRPWQMPSGKDLKHIKVFVDGIFVTELNWEFDEPLQLPLAFYYPGICYEFLPVYSEGSGPSFEVCDSFIQYQLSLLRPYPVTSAEWYYDYLHFYTSGYIHIWFAGDTTIQGKPAGIVKKEGHYYNQELFSYYQQDLGKEYFSADEDRVFVYRHEQFYTLWDFSAEVGDSWIIPGSNDMFCDSTALVTVEQTGDTLINGQLLRWFVLDYFGDESGQWNYFGKIIERVGPINDYLLPSSTCMVDAAEGGSLRCYEDADFGLFSTGISQRCDYLLNTIEPETGKGFAMHPNPASDEVWIRWQTNSGEVNYTVYSRDGRVWLNGRKEFIIGNEQIFTLNTSSLPAGSYSIAFQTEGATISKQLIIMR